MHKKINQTYQIHQQLQYGYLPLFPEHHGSHFIYAGLATLALIGGMGSTPIILAETLVLEQTESVMKDRAVDDKTTDATSAITTPDELPKTELTSATAEATTPPKKAENAPEESSATATATKEPTKTVAKVPDTAATTSKNDASKTEANNSSAEKNTADKPDTAKTDATKTTESATPTVAEPQTPPKAKNTRAAVAEPFTVTFYYAATGETLGAKTFTGDVDQVFNADPSNFTGSEYTFLAGFTFGYGKLEHSSTPQSWNSFDPKNMNISYGDNDGTNYAYYYGKPYTVQYQYIDQDDKIIPGLQPAPITGYDFNGTTYSKIPLPYVWGATSNALISNNDDGKITLGGTKLITYQFQVDDNLPFTLNLRHNGSILKTFTFTGKSYDLVDLDPAHFIGPGYEFLDGYVFRWGMVGGEVGWRRSYVYSPMEINTAGLIVSIGINNGRDYEYYYAQTGSVQYQYVDQNNVPIADYQPALIDGFDDIGYDKVPAPVIPGYYAGVLTSDNDNGAIIGGTTKLITYKYQAVPVPAQPFNIGFYHNDQLLETKSFSGNTNQNINVDPTSFTGVNYQFLNGYIFREARREEAENEWTAFNPASASINLGTNLGHNFKYYYAQAGTVQYRYVDQNNNPIDDVQPAPITGYDDTGYNTVTPPTIPGYLSPQLTSNNDDGAIVGGTTKTITYQYMQASVPFSIQYVDPHEVEISAPLNHVGGLPVTDMFSITGAENSELENYDFQKLQRQGWNGNWIDVATALPFQDNLGNLGGFNYRLVYARMNSMTQMYVDENGAPINLDNVTEVDESGDAHWTTIGDEGDEYTAHGAIEIPGYVYEKLADDSDAVTGTYDATSQKIVKYQYKTIAKAGTLYRVDTEGTVINTETFGDGPNNSTSFITDRLALTAPEIAGFQYNNEIWYTDDLPNENASWHVYDGDLASLPTTLGANNGRSYKFVYAAATTVIHKYVNQDGDEITMGTDDVPPVHFLQFGFVGDPYIVHDAPVIAGYGEPTLKSVDLPNTMTAGQLEIVYEYRTNAQPITIYRVDTDDNDLGTETLTGHYTDEDLDLTPKQFAGYDFQNLFGSAVDENESAVRMVIPDLNWQAADVLAYTTLKHGANHGRHYKFVYAKHVATPATEPSNTPIGGNPVTDNNQPQPTPAVTTPTPDKPTPNPGKVPGDGTLPGTGDTSGNNSPTPGTQNNPNIVVNPLNTPVVNQNTAPNNSAELPKSGSTRNYWLPILGSTLIATLLGLAVFNKKRKR